MTKMEKALAYSNPIGWPILLGLGLSAMCVAIFGNLAKETKKNMERVYK